MEEITLLKAAKTMNKDALTKIFDLYAPAIYNYALRLCNDSLVADHIVGDVFARLLDHLSAGKGPRANLRSYLYQAAYHLLVDEIRYSRRRVSFEVVDFLRYDTYLSALTSENRIIFETVLQAIQRDLTDDQRHVIVLRFLEGLSLYETAGVLGKEIGNIKVIQNRAITVLRKAVVYQELVTRSNPVTRSGESSKALGI